MSAFDSYGKYYDLLNAQKDYGAEADYVFSLIERVCPHPGSVLELGCGTGGHAYPLIERGLEVHGIDLSSAMIERASERKNDLAPDLSDRLQFTTADLRSFRAERAFDAVISLFHVISYQPSNMDLRKAFESARTHLAVGGAFVFDCWYGPAVLTDPPYVRTREYRGDQLSATRTATPELLVNRNLVKVQFDFEILGADGESIDRFSEEHWMRYLFLPETEAFLEDTGFRLRDAFKWLSTEPPGTDTWYAVFVAEAV